VSVCGREGGSEGGSVFVCVCVYKGEGGQEREREGGREDMRKGKCVCE
jgi:hypothetical protein